MVITTKLHVSGMTCSSCVNSIAKELEKNSSIHSTNVSLLTEEAIIIHEDSIKPDEIAENIEDLGFDATVISSIGNENARIPTDSLTSIIHVGGMTCSSCSNAITNHLSKLDGVEKVEVSLLTEEVTVLHKASILVNALIENIEDIGFDAELLTSKSCATAAISGVFQTEKNNTSPLKFTTELIISGMTCSSCVNTIISQLETVNGVLSVTVSLMTEKAVVIHDTSILSDEIKDHIENLGFDASIVDVFEMSPTASSTAESMDILTICLKIYGMNTATDAESMEQCLNNIAGIVNFHMNTATQEITIEYDSNIVGIRLIMSSIQEYGFDAVLANKLDTTSQIDLLTKVKEVQYWKTNFFQLLAFGLPILFLSHVLPIIFRTCGFNKNNLKIAKGIYVDILLQFIIGTYIQFILGKRYYINCSKALSHGSGSMDVLICCSTSIIYFYSLFTIIYGMFTDTYPNILLDTSLMLFVFVSLGKWIESKAKGNTSTALSKLLSLTPLFCTIVENPEIFSNHEESINAIDTSLFSQKTISVDLLQKNDVAIVLPGSKIPSDGECIFGKSEVDESLLTGESLPIKKQAGSKLIGGSVNLSSTIYMRIKNIGEQTQLQQIVKLVKDAQSSNAPIQRFSDMIASYFVHAILIFSTLTLVFWLIYVSVTPINLVPKIFIDTEQDPPRIFYYKILQVAISVIVVACPCALGLAAPAAVMVGTGVGAMNGILIKGGDVLEKASKVNCVIFDKTGTLTRGVMGLAKYKFSTTYSQQTHLIWSLLYAIELNSEHPIAKAIVEGCVSELKSNKPQSFELAFTESHAGLGISSVLIENETRKQYDVKVGNAKLMKKLKILNSEEFTKDVNEITQDSKICSIAYVLINNEYAGFVELSDSLKPDAKLIVKTLHSYGFSVGMVTGDSAETSRFIANELNIPLNNVLADSSPKQKLEFIRLLQEEKGLVVAFVGDGINDAPALVQSDVGIAISTGTDIAMSSADIVLLSSNSEFKTDQVADNQPGNTDVDLELDSGLNSLNSHMGLLGISACLDISRATFKTIKTNFLLAIIYNMIMLPIAMGLLIIPFSITMHPMFASTAMACSSISVVGNSLMLKNWTFQKLMKKIKYAVNTNYTDASKLYELGCDDSLVDTRSSINILSTKGFVVASSYKTLHKKSIWNRLTSFVSSRFKKEYFARNNYVALESPPT